VTSFIFNQGSSGHRGVWHAVEGEVEIRTVEERVSDYTNSYRNVRSIHTYPEHKEYSAKTMCSSFKSYSGKRKMTVRDEVSSPGYPRRTRAVLETVETTSKVKPCRCIAIEPPYTPEPLCYACRSKVEANG
jgi:hypothetical protein